MNRKIAFAILTLIALSMAAPMALAETGIQEFGGKVVQVTIDYSHGMLKDLRVAGKEAIYEIIPQYFKSPFGNSTDGFRYSFGSRDFSIQFIDVNPTVVQISAGINMNELKVILPEEAKASCHCHHGGSIRIASFSFGDIRMQVTGLTTFFKVYNSGGKTVIEIQNSEPIVKTLVFRIIALHQGGKGKVGQISYQVNGSYVRDVKVNSKEIIYDVFLGGKINETGFNLLIGKYGAMKLSSIGNYWMVGIATYRNSTVTANFSISLHMAYLVWMGKEVWYNETYGIIVIGIGAVEKEGKEFMIKDGARLIVIPKNAVMMPLTLMRIKPNEEHRFGHFLVSFGKEGIRYVAYCVQGKKGTSPIKVVGNVSMGELLRGAMGPRGAVVFWKRGITKLSPEVIEIMGKGISMEIYAKEVAHRGGSYSFHVGNVAILCVGHWNYEKGKLYGSGAVEIREVHIIWGVGKSPLKFNVSEEGLRNLTYLGFPVGNVTFQAGNFIGSYGKVAQIFKWENATVVYRWHESSTILGIKANGNITFEFNPQIKVRRVTRDIALLIYNGKAYGMIFGHIIYAKGNEVITQNCANFVISPGILERMAGMYHRAIESIKISNGEISGKYVHVRFSVGKEYPPGIIFNYTVRGVQIANVIDLRELWTPNPKVFDKASLLAIRTGLGTVMIHDDAAGPLAVHFVGNSTTNSAEIKVWIPEDSVLLKVEKHVIEYKVEGQLALIAVTRGNLSINGTVISVELLKGGNFIILSPISPRIGAYVDVRNTSKGIEVSPFSVSQGINVSAEYEPGKILVKIKGEGNGTILDVELCPSAFPMDQIPSIKVQMDGKELSQVPFEELEKTMQGYSVYFDGNALHLLIGIPHFSEHQIVVEYNSTTSATVTGGTPTPTSTPTMTSTPSPPPKVSSGKENMKVIVGAVIGIVAAGVIALIISRR